MWILTIMSAILATFGVAHLTDATTERSLRKLISAVLIIVLAGGGLVLRWELYGW